MAKTPLPCWPKFMPAPQRSAYQYEPTDRRIKTDMEIGSIYRNEFDTDETVIQCNMILCNRVQLEFFEAFERDCLNQGTRWFVMPIWINGRLEEYKCRFKARPKYGSLVGLSHTTVSMQIEIEERNLLDPAVMGVLLYFGPSGIEDVTKAIRPGITIIPEEVWANP